MSEHPPKSPPEPAAVPGPSPDGHGSQARPHPHEVGAGAGPDVAFESLHLHADLLKGIRDLGFVRPTPIQVSIIW